MSRKLSEQEIIRREKMEDLRKKGIDPFGSAFKVTHKSAELVRTYDKRTKEQKEMEKEKAVKKNGK